MNSSPSSASADSRRSFLRLPGWLAKVATDSTQEWVRVRTVERDLGLPVRGVVLVILYYHLFYTPWFENVQLLQEGVQEIVRWFFVVYAGINVVAGVFLSGFDEIAFRVIREVVLVLSVLDSVFLAALTAVTGGFDSILFWVFVGLVVRNSMSMPEATRQILINGITILCFVAGGAAEQFTRVMEFEMLDTRTLQAVYPQGQEGLTEPVILRVFVLGLMAACCYGVEVLFDRQRQIEEESREVAQRQRQLESAGRLAAEIAHQLKNPLGIINNAAYTLQKTVKEGKTITQQIHIIREEVDRSDRIITELMGYARLVEGRVERLDLNAEVEAALAQVFPAAASFEVTLHRDLAGMLPPLLAQRAHIQVVLVNLLQNAREAMNGRGNLWVETALESGLTVMLTIRDDGPGIPAENLPRIFEAHFSTKEKGTGLGLAIVRHNTELYGGTVEVDSAPGKGSAFRLRFPARTVLQLRR